MTNKDASYHRAAIMYNEELAVFAEELSERLEHEEIARWSKAISKQHKFHAGRHKKALAKIEDGETPANPDADDEAYETRHPQDTEVVHRDAGSGEFVTEDYADENPNTTVADTVPKASGDVKAPFEVKNTDAAPDASQAAEPVENQGETNA